MTDIVKTMDTSKYDHSEISDQIDKFNRQLEGLTDTVLNARGRANVINYTKVLNGS